MKSLISLLDVCKVHMYMYYFVLNLICYLIFFRSSVYSQMITFFEHFIFFILLFTEIVPYLYSCIFLIMQLFSDLLHYLHSWKRYLSYIKFLLNSIIHCVKKTPGAIQLHIQKCCKIYKWNVLLKIYFSGIWIEIN